VEDTHEWAVHRAQPTFRPNDAELDDLATRLNQAGSVTLYCGYGARNAHDQVVALAERLQAPVVHSSRAKEFIEPDNPFNIGMTGILGNRAGVNAIKRADITLCLGTDFAWTQFYPERQRVIQVDLDSTHLGKRAPIELGLVGDIAATIDAVLPNLEAKQDKRHLDKMLH